MRQIIIYLFCFLTIPSFSQENISLEQAVQLGLKKNYDILISKKDHKIHSINNNWGNAGALPQINISSKIEKNLTDQSNNPTSFIQQILKSDAINANANINWTLFNGFAIKANKEKLNQLQNLSDGNLTLIIENTLEGIILSYYNCIVQQKRLELLQEVVNISEDRLIYEKTKQDLGTSSKIEYLQRENTLLNDRSNLEIQKMNLANSVKNFNILIGMEINRSWFFNSELTHDFQMYNYNVLLEKTLSNNSNIQNQNINIRLANQDIKLSTSIFYPMISFNSGASYNQSNYDLGNVEYDGSTTGSSLNYFANLTISLRLFDGGKLHSTLQKIKVQKEKHSLELDKIKINVSNQLAKILDEYNSRIVIYNINKRAYEIARTNYELAINKQNRGVISSFILRDIETSFINSGISFLQSSYNLKQSEISLLKITGGIISYNKQGK